MLLLLRVARSCWTEKAVCQKRVCSVFRLHAFHNRWGARLDLGLSPTDFFSSTLVIESKHSTTNSSSSSVRSTTFLFPRCLPLRSGVVVDSVATLCADYLTRVLPFTHYICLNRPQLILFCFLLSFSHIRLFRSYRTTPPLFVVAINALVFRFISEAFHQR